MKDLTLELTQICFQGCLYCSSGSTPSDDVQLSFDTVMKVLNDFSGMGGTVVELSGGEPFAYDKIGEVIRYAKQQGLKIHLFTSANLLNEEIEMNELTGVDRIYVNLQSPISEIHDYLTQTSGSFERAISFMKECKKKGMWVGTHFIPLALNVGEIEEYVEFAKLLKLNNVSLLRFVEQGRGRENVLSLNNDEILYLFSAIEKYRETKCLNFKIGCPMDFGFIYRRSRTAIPCSSGVSRCLIRPNGSVIPCPAFKDAKEFVAGNVNDSSLESIWENPETFRDIRTFDYRKLKGACSDCPFLEICRGRCHAQRYHHHGDLYMGPDPYCPLSLS